MERQLGNVDNRPWRDGCRDRRAGRGRRGPGRGRRARHRESAGRHDRRRSRSWNRSCGTSSSGAMPRPGSRGSCRSSPSALHVTDSGIVRSPDRRDQLRRHRTRRVFLRPLLEDSVSRPPARCSHSWPWSSEPGRRARRFPRGPVRRLEHRAGRRGHRGVGLPCLALLLHGRTPGAARAAVVVEAPASATARQRAPR
jgi:hypothetical protein